MIPQTIIEEKVIQLFKEKDYSKIQHLLCDESLKDHNSSRLYFFRSLLEKSLKKIDKAIDYISMAIMIDPNNPELFRQRGHFWASQRMFAASIEDYSTAIKLNPDNAELYFDRAVIFGEMKNINSAIEDYNRAIKLNPYYFQALYNRGMSYYQLMHFYSSLQDFDKVISINPSYAIAYFGRAQIFEKGKEYEKALANLNKAISLNNRVYEFYVSRGFIWFNKDNFENALSDYNKAIQINPKESLVYTRKGLLYSALEKFPEAIKNYSEALTISPADPDSLLLRGNAYFNIKYYDSALQNYMSLKAVTANKYTDVDYRIELARMNCELHDGLEVCFELDKNINKTRELKYSHGRPSSFPAHYMERYYQLLVEFFNEEWLEGEGSHPLQLLWRRRDEMANEELFSLAKCLEVLSKIDKNWVNDQVSKVKHPLGNTRIGALREILVLGDMHSLYHPVTPAKKNQPGYDGIMKLKPGLEMRISVKSYGMTFAHKTFEAKALEIKNIVFRLISRYMLYPVNVLIECPGTFPLDHHWELLESQLEELFQQFTPGEINEAYTNNEDGSLLWSIKLVPIPDTGNKLHPQWSSSIINISVLRHKNEFNNLINKLEEACANLIKHSAVENDHIINSLHLSIPGSVSIKACYDHLVQYLNSSNPKPISWIFLHQAQINGNLRTAEAQLEHCVLEITRGQLNNWSKSERPLIFVYPTGRVTNQPTSYTIGFRNEKGEEFGVKNLDDRYVFQYGELYYKEEFEYLVGRLGDGIHANIVRREDNGAWIISKPLLLQREQLLIL